MITPILMMLLFYALLAYTFSFAGIRPWYAFIPIWSFYCWARMVHLKNPIYSALMSSILFYGSNFVLPWYVRIFGMPIDDSAVNMSVQMAMPQILVSKTEFYLFGLFSIALIVGIYAYVRLCWRLAQAFSFKGWLGFLMILFPPLSLVLGLIIIVASRRPFKVLPE